MQLYSDKKQVLVCVGRGASQVKVVGSGEGTEEGNSVIILSGKLSETAQASNTTCLLGLNMSLTNHKALCRAQSS